MQDSANPMAHLAPSRENRQCLPTDSGRIGMYPSRARGRACRGWEASKAMELTQLRWRKAARKVFFFDGKNLFFLVANILMNEYLGILSSLSEVHGDSDSYEACSELDTVLNNMAGNYIVLRSSCMDKAPNPTTTRHIAAYVRRERHYYIFSDGF